MRSDAEEIKYKLSELAGAAPETIEGGVVEIFWQDQHENESSTEESVPAIAQGALERIKELEAAVLQAIGWAESTASIKPEDGGETLRRLKEVVGYQPPLL